jgi:hypothetical protein
MTEDRCLMAVSRRRDRKKGGGRECLRVRQAA